MYCEIDDEEGFVSIDLEDEFEECDICHQATDEKIVNVILSDEFTQFEGSHEKHCGTLTKAHQICLNKWSDIIQRNLDYSKRNNSPDIRERTILHQKTENHIKNENLIEPNTFMEHANIDDVFESSQDLLEVSYESKSKEQLSAMCSADVKDLLSQLDKIATETSYTLVKELQIRDRLHQEISGQKSLIAQLVKMEKKNVTAVSSKCHTTT